MCCYTQADMKTYHHYLNMSLLKIIKLLQKSSLGKNHVSQVKYFLPQDTKTIGNLCQVYNITVKPVLSGHS